MHRLLSLRKQQHYLEYSIVFTIILDDNYNKHSKKKKRKSRLTKFKRGREISCANGTGYSLGFIFDDVLRTSNVLIVSGGDGIILSIKMLQIH